MSDTDIRGSRQQLTPRALPQVGQQHDSRYSMLFHLLTLSSFEPHPLAAEPILTWPEALSRPRISLGFQIADDGLFVLRHNGGGPLGPADQLCGWQWTTGRQGVVSTLDLFAHKQY